MQDADNGTTSGVQTLGLVFDMPAFQPFSRNQRPAHIYLVAEPVHSVVVEVYKRHVLRARYVQKYSYRLDNRPVGSVLNGKPNGAAATKYPPGQQSEEHPKSGQSIL